MKEVVFLPRTYIGNSLSQEAVGIEIINGFRKGLNEFMKEESSKKV